MPTSLESAVRMVQVAAIRGRAFVEPDDVKRIVAPVMTHRIIVRPESRLRKITPETIIKEIRDIHEGLRRVAQARAELQVAGKEPEELAAMTGRLEAQMKEAARNLEFEKAALLRDQVVELRRVMETDPVTVKA